MTKRNNTQLPWYRRSVFYQIYPWSFKDSNGDGIGDIKGIIKKLDYLNDGTTNSLGIGAIWISPIYPSPMKDFGYDISDYCGIDSRFGDIQIFDELVKKANDRGIKIMMDLVTNHTSNIHPWFVESSSSKNNPKRDWYIWHDPRPDGSPPNNWISVSGGSVWTMDEKTGQYYLHNFLPEQPDLNWRNPAVQTEMKKVIEFWIKRGVKGFRIDAANHFIEDSEFRDDPPNKSYVDGKHSPYDKYSHTYSVNRPETKDIFGMMCDIADNNEEIFIVSETYLGIRDIKNFYSFCQTSIHAPFNFLLMGQHWNALAFRKSIDAFEKILRPKDIPVYAIGNHDHSRLVTVRGKLQARALGLLLLTLRGTPFIYYGDEIGMEDGIIPKSESRDGFIGKGNSYNRDPERTPMQWNTTENAGFSTGRPWLPVSEKFKIQNVETEANDPRSIFNMYRKLITYRNQSEILLSGNYYSITTDSRNIFAYIREFKNERLMVLINFSDQTISERLVTGLHNVVMSSLMDIPTDTVISESISMRPYEAYLIKLESKSDKPNRHERGFFETIINSLFNPKPFWSLYNR